MMDTETNKKNYPEVKTFLDSLGVQFREFNLKRTDGRSSHKDISGVQIQYIDYLINEISSSNSCEATQELRDFAKILIKIPGNLVPSYALWNVLKSFQENQ